jgi:transcriptional regulator with XRE-family HTH domain
MTQPQLAAAAGIKQPSLSELETGETKEITGSVLISLAKALRVRAEWLLTGEEPIEIDPAGWMLTSDEREMLDLYRGASNRWKVAIKYMASLRADAHQDLAAESMNVVFARIAATPVPDSKLGDKWTRPDKKT